jgi:hypothetical protein
VATSQMRLMSSDLTTVIMSAASSPTI